MYIELINVLNMIICVNTVFIASIVYYVNYTFKQI